LELNAEGEHPDPGQRAAGYSEKTAKPAASRLLTNVNVAEEIANDPRKQHGNAAKAAISEAYARSDRLQASKESYSFLKVSSEIAGAFRNPSARRSRKSLIVWMQNTSLSVFRKHLFSEHD
jgi:hypothetical protein